VGREVLLGIGFNIIQMFELSPEERQRFRNILFIHALALKVENFHVDDVVMHGRFKRVAEHSRLDQQEKAKHTR
jgi:hypothetical protein